MSWSASASHCSASGSCSRALMAKALPCFCGWCQRLFAAGVARFGLGHTQAHLRSVLDIRHMGCVGAGTAVIQSARPLSPRAAQSSPSAMLDKICSAVTRTIIPHAAGLGTVRAGAAALINTVCQQGKSHGAAKLGCFFKAFHSLRPVALHGRLPFQHLLSHHRGLPAYGRVQQTIEQSAVQRSRVRLHHRVQRTAVGPSVERASSMASCRV